MKRTLFWILSSCLLLSGCSMRNTSPNTLANITTNKVVQANTTTKKYQPIEFPALPEEEYKTSVPVVLLKEQLTTNSPIQPKPPKTVTVDIPPSLKQDFVAYFAYGANPNHPLFIVLPKDMKPSGENLVGQDGSFSFDFQGGDGTTFSVNSSGPCYGCAAGAGAPFFVSAENANEQDGQPKQPTMKQLGAKVIYPQTDLALYGYTLQGVENVGFNQYDTDMIMHPWGIDFAVEFKGKNLITNTLLPWTLENLIRQNQGFSYVLSSQYSNSADPSSWLTCQTQNVTIEPGIAVEFKVPTGWRKQDKSTGDGTLLVWTNPSNSKEFVRVLFSANGGALQNSKDQYDVTSYMNTPRVTWTSVAKDKLSGTFDIPSGAVFNTVTGYGYAQVITKPEPMGVTVEAVVTPNIEHLIVGSVSINGQ